MAYKFVKCAVIFVAFFISVSNAYAGVEEDYKAGLAAQESKDYENAYAFYKKAAEQGYVPAQYKMGVMYGNGFGVQLNDEKAIEWYLKAAKKGYAKAENNLGFAYYLGRGVSINYKEAAKWWKKAAAQGEAMAQHNLAASYKRGKGVPKSVEEAVRWYWKAAAQEHASSIAVLEELKKEGDPQVLAVLEELKKEEERKKKLGQLINEEPFKDNKRLLRAMEKGVATKWISRSSSDEKTGVALMGFVAGDTLDTLSCYLYVGFTIEPIPSHNVVTVNGTDVKFHRLSFADAFMNYGNYVAETTAGRKYVFNEFRNKSKVNIEYGGKSNTFSAIGFVEGAKNTMTDCERTMNKKKEDTAKRNNAL